MQINIPRIVRDLPLKEYAPEMGEAVIKVWVNPTRDYASKFVTVASDDVEVVVWYAGLLSQDSDPATHWTPDELQLLFETDPALWGWINSRAWNMIEEHRTGLEKKRERP